jgi:hypothetical protein
MSCDGNLHWIARVMGHRNTGIITKECKYIENFTGSQNGNNLNNFYKGNIKKNEYDRVKANYGKIAAKIRQKCEKGLACRS